MGEMNNSETTIQLIDPLTCLISEIGTPIPPSIEKSHALIFVPTYKGFLIKLNLLSSLKRCLAQIGIFLPSIPNVAFKMFKGWNRPSKSVNRKSFDIQYLGPWKLTPQQKKVIDLFCDNGCRRLIIGDSPLMGKTITSISSFHSCRIKKILIICPKILILYWREQLYSLNSSKELIRVLDWNEEKQQQFKVQTKDEPIKCQIQYEYAIASFEYLKKISTSPTIGFSLNHYTGVIVDQPLSIHFENVFFLRSIENFIILKSNLTIEETRFWLPIVNNRVQPKQINERYGKVDQTIKHSLQYAYSVKRIFYIAHSSSQFRRISNLRNIIIESDKIEEQCLRYINYLKKSQKFSPSSKILFIYQNDQIIENFQEKISQKFKQFIIHMKKQQYLQKKQICSTDISHQIKEIIYLPKFSPNEQQKDINDLSNLMFEENGCQNINILQIYDKNFKLAKYSINIDKILFRNHQIHLKEKKQCVLHIQQNIKNSLSNISFPFKTALLEKNDSKKDVNKRNKNLKETKIIQKRKKKNFEWLSIERQRIIELEDSNSMSSNIGSQKNSSNKVQLQVIEKQKSCSMILQKNQSQILQNKLRIVLNPNKQTLRKTQLQNIQEEKSHLQENSIPQTEKNSANSQIQSNQEKQGFQKNKKISFTFLGDYYEQPNISDSKGKQSVTFLKEAKSMNNDKIQQQKKKKLQIINAQQEIKFKNDCIKEKEQFRVKKKSTEAKKMRKTKNKTASVLKIKLMPKTSKLK